MDRVLWFSESGIVAEQTPCQVSNIDIYTDLFDELGFDEIFECLILVFLNSGSDSVALLLPHLRQGKGRSPKFGLAVFGEVNHVPTTLHAVSIRLGN